LLVCCLPVGGLEEFQENFHMKSAKAAVKRKRAENSGTLLPCAALSSAALR
jgi:hypothetical protein